jgi:hypothetical protein
VLNLPAGRLTLNGLALRLALPLAAALLAALAAHVAIDVAGDYLLAHDTYDAAAHGSRWLASGGVAVLAFGALWALVRATLAETRGSHGALRAVLRTALPLGSLRFAAVVAFAALPMLLAMARLDASCAGSVVQNLDDLLGGSIPLGCGMTLAFAAASAFGTYRLVAILSRFHRSIVRAVEAFVRLARLVARAARILVASTAPDRPRVPAALARCTRANRAPPSLAAAVFVPA